MSQSVRVYFWLILMTAVFFSTALLAATNDSGIKTQWGYRGHTGPEFWGRLSPHFLLCGEGTSQSPINISKNDIQTANTLSLHYEPAPLVIMDDGNTELTIGTTQTIFNDGHTIQINFSGKQQRHANDFINFRGDTYQLVQFHFHSPSENQLNGDSAPLEMHFVHQGKKGKVLVIGVLIKGGGANPDLQDIIDHLPVADGKAHAIPGQTVSPSHLFPLDNDYYSFQGSLTTPPCTEGLQWVVMASTITASPAQIATIRKALGGTNARAVQPLNNRVIAYSPGKIS